MVTFAASELALQRTVAATFKLRCFMQVVAATFRLRKEDRYTITQALSLAATNLIIIANEQN